MIKDGDQEILTGGCEECDIGIKLYIFFNEIINMY